MFTGLIQGIGTFTPVATDRWAIKWKEPVPDSLSVLELGDSIAVDGVCLTVDTIVTGGFVAVASPETLNMTTLGNRPEAATYVNLEPSLRVGGKLGGHFVTGHVDGVGCLQEIQETSSAWEIWFASVPSLKESWQKQIAPYIVRKGSIAVNGISLTVAESDIAGNCFKVAVIPHTFAETNLRYLKIGTWVNLEADILGKYVENFLTHHQSQEEVITLEFLAEHGY
ncbi:riboflavin synthase [Merismopedia glauca]|uniref:Riboflavin synthase n=1 Tax=Merismopedia glauca CCAP 1448/3 TaxID=1296344 RepID=A0A2T1C226_9CYAN|nr:riboflavin synthase [Merismopedia glauca]PSB02228.1 riboflavin synthase [Merismopedia glauca CCAP 1448/3]